MSKAETQKHNQLNMQHYCSRCGNRLPGGNLLTSFLVKKCQCPEIVMRDESSAESEEFDGTKIDLGEGFTVLSRIGHGGNATVYRVRDRMLNKTFAFKVLHADLATDLAARQRFEQEARAARDLTHPNMVAIYRNGITPNNAPYLVMDCLDGETLDSLLKKENVLDPKRALDIFIQICDGLIHMHMKNIVHRDLKPSNVFITPGDDDIEHVKIVDFGIAKQHNCDSTQFTRMGEVLGSPPYMSPEQCQGEEVDFRSDVYSLGCLMFETLTGRSPFDQGTPVKTVLSHINSPVPYLKSFSNNPELSKFEAIVRHSLEKNPKNRYQNIDAVRADLIAIRDTGKLVKSPCEVLPATWKRVAASLIDGGIVSSIAIAITFAIAQILHIEISVSFNFVQPILVVFASILVGPGFAVFLSANLAALNTILLLKIVEFIIGSVIFPIYYIGFDQSALKGTPGKKLLGLSVVNDFGRRISLKQSVVRYASKICLYWAILTETHTRALPVRGQNVLQVISTWFKELTQSLKLTPTDIYSGAYVVNDRSLDNPFVPNLKENFTRSETSASALHTYNKATLAFFWVLLFMIPMFVVTTSPPPGVKQVPCDFWTVWCTVGNLIIIDFGIYLTYRSYKQRIKSILADRKRSEQALGYKSKNIGIDSI
ncbi:MAG: protein kinase [Candidatus Obscuribacterales bacterium]|nr:protein kinase [Candidatus Obscuribacterales bacterium]